MRIKRCPICNKYFKNPVTGVKALASNRQIFNLKKKIMGPFTVGLLVPLGAFAMIFGIVYMIITARNKERLALIERGADPSLFETVKKNQPNKVMKWGLFLLGVGLGFVVGDMMEKNGMMSEDYAYVSMICVFGGIALIVAHVFERRQEKEKIEG